jgi:hypothetical protein
MESVSAAQVTELNKLSRWPVINEYRKIREDVSVAY